MQFELNLFRADFLTRTITHRAGYTPGDEAAPGTWGWHPIAQKNLPHELESARRAMRLFTCVKWSIPERTNEPIAYGNIRQMLNPHGSGTGGLAQAGIAGAFVRWALEYPRVQVYVKGVPGGLEIGGVEYIDADKPKPKPSKNKTTLDAAFDEYEYSTGGFDTQCTAFKRYVDWVGANAGCVRAAQGVILAFDRLVEALRECGIDRVDELSNVYVRVENALEEMCLALADAETATGKQCQAVAPIAPTQQPIVIVEPPKATQGRKKKRGKPVKRKWHENPKAEKLLQIAACVYAPLKYGTPQGIPQSVIENLRAAMDRQSRRETMRAMYNSERVEFRKTMLGAKDYATVTAEEKEKCINSWAQHLTDYMHDNPPEIGIYK